LGKRISKKRTGVSKVLVKRGSTFVKEHPHDLERYPELSGGRTPEGGFLKGKEEEKRRGTISISGQSTPKSKPTGTSFRDKTTRKEWQPGANTKG